MNEDERKMQQNIQRVALNLAVLLDIGLFPGKHSTGLGECQQFVAQIIADATTKLQGLTPPPTPAPAPQPAPAAA